MPRIFSLGTAIALVLSLAGLPASARDGGGADLPPAGGMRPRVSPDGRYFVDQDGTPVFWLGTTQWQLFHDSWRVLPTWKRALDAPGAVQMGILRKVFEARQEWWHLVPDQTILARGGNTRGTVLNLAARHRDGRWLMVYLGDRATFAIDRSKFTGGRKASASWIDPRTGRSVSIGEVPGSGVQQFTTPEGWEDALLILESPGEPARVPR
jgi:hypothetical protein